MLSHSNVRQTTYCNSDGQVLYRAETEYKISQRTTKITKVVPNSSVDDMSRSLSSSALPKVTLIFYLFIQDDQFSDLASIEWATLSNSKLKYGAFEGPIKDFLRSSGILSQYVHVFADIDKFYLRLTFARHRTFSTPDGKRYKWTMGIRISSVRVLLSLKYISHIPHYNAASSRQMMVPKRLLPKCIGGGWVYSPAEKHGIQDSISSLALSI